MWRLINQKEIGTYGVTYVHKSIRKTQTNVSLYPFEQYHEYAKKSVFFTRSYQVAFKFKQYQSISDVCTKNYTKYC